MTRLVIQTSAPTLAGYHAGRFRFINRLSRLLVAQKWNVSVRQQAWVDPLRDRFDGAYHLHEITGAHGRRALNYRRAYLFPWWMFDHPHQRYGGRIGAMKYDPHAIDGRAARLFLHEFQRHYLTDWGRGDPSGAVLIPLQGALARQRDWQFANLASMVATIRQHDPAREILLKPHPKETYGAADQALLRSLAMQPNVIVTSAEMPALMGRAAYLVTHNSAAAFEAMVLGIPSMLFAKADFHHICPVVRQPSDAAAAFAQINGERPDFARYLYWFLEMNCVHAGRDDAFGRIAELLAACGWPVSPLTGPMTRANWP